MAEGEKKPLIAHYYGVGNEKKEISSKKELDEICVSDIGISGIENASDECSVVLLYCGAERVTCRVGKSGLTAEIVFISVLGSAYKTVAVCKFSLAAVLVGSTYRVVESLCDLRILCRGYGFVEDKAEIVSRGEVIGLGIAETGSEVGISASKLFGLLVHYLAEFCLGSCHVHAECNAAVVSRFED